METLKEIEKAGDRERICTKEEIKHLTLFKLPNNIVVVESERECVFLGEEGTKIKKNRPWIVVEGEEYTYYKDILLIETTETATYKGIFKIME